MVELACGVGIPEHEIAHAVINPATKRPITAMTLRKHFRDELDKGLVSVKIKAGYNLLAMTQHNAACAIFFAKCRLGFNERASWTQGPYGAPPPPVLPGVTDEELQAADGKSMTEIARRIAWTLTMGAETTEKTPAPALKPRGHRKGKKKQVLAA